MAKISITQPSDALFAANEVRCALSFGGCAAKLTARLNAAQKAVDNEVMKQMEPYMQFKSGSMITSMRASTNVGSGEVVVNTPYARAVHDSGAGIGRPTGPLRGPHFFARMKADKAGAILQAAKHAAGGK